MKQQACGLARKLTSKCNSLNVHLGATTADKALQHGSAINKLQSSRFRLSLDFLEPYEIGSSTKEVLNVVRVSLREVRMQLLTRLCVRCDELSTEPSTRRAPGHVCGRIFYSPGLYRTFDD